MNTAKDTLNLSETGRVAIAKTILREIQNRADRGEEEAFRLFVNIAANATREVELLRLAHPKLVKKIAARRINWPVLYTSSKKKNADVLKWINSSVCRGLKPGRKSRDLGAASVLWATALREIIERIREGELDRLGWKNPVIVNGVAIRRIGESSETHGGQSLWHEEDFIHRTKRSLPPLSRRTFEKWFNLAWYMLLRFSDAGTQNASAVIATGEKKREAEIAIGLQKVSAEYERSVTQRKKSSRAKALAGSLLIKFPEDVKMEADVTAVVSHAERRRVALVRKKFRALCEKIWLG